jgi:hypothetical protein
MTYLYQRCIKAGYITKARDIYSLVEEVAIYLRKTFNLGEIIASASVATPRVYNGFRTAMPVYRITRRM